jgi:hypothetical protein
VSGWRRIAALVALVALACSEDAVRPIGRFALIEIGGDPLPVETGDAGTGFILVQVADTLVITETGCSNIDVSYFYPLSNPSAAPPATTDTIHCQVRTSGGLTVDMGGKERPMTFDGANTITWMQFTRARYDAIWVYRRVPE